MFESTQKWRFGEDDFPFQLGDFQVNQPFIFGCVVQPITSNRKKHVVFFVANHETSGHDELKVEDKEDDTNDVIRVLSTRLDLDCYRCRYRVNPPGGISYLVPGTQMCFWLEFIFACFWKVLEGSPTTRKQNKHSFQDLWCKNAWMSLVQLQKCCDSTSGRS